MARKRTKIDLETKEITELTERIANLLGETDPKALQGIRATIAVGGSQFALQQLVKVAKMKQAGVTMKTDDGRYRTLGGCFFKTVKDTMTGSQRYLYMSIVSPKKRKGDRNGR
jgi:hypothetical protein